MGVCTRSLTEPATFATSPLPPPRPRVPTLLPLNAEKTAFRVTISLQDAAEDLDDSAGASSSSRFSYDLECFALDSGSTAPLSKHRLIATASSDSSTAESKSAPSEEAAPASVFADLTGLEAGKQYRLLLTVSDAQHKTTSEPREMTLTAGSAHAGVVTSSLSSSKPSSKRSSGAASSSNNSSSHGGASAGAGKSASGSRARVSFKDADDSDDESEQRTSAPKSKSPAGRGEAKALGKHAPEPASSPQTSASAAKSKASARNRKRGKQAAVSDNSETPDEQSEPAEEDAVSATKASTAAKITRKAEAGPRLTPAEVARRKKVQQRQTRIAIYCVLGIVGFICLLLAIRWYVRSRGLGLSLGRSRSSSS